MVAVFALFAVIEIAVALDLIYFYFDPGSYDAISCVYDRPSSFLL
jgi:hypothetical protein